MVIARGADPEPCRRDAVRELLGVARPGQAARPLEFGGHVVDRTADHHVGARQAAAVAQHPTGLGDRPVEVVRETEHALGQRDVDRRVPNREVGEVAAERRSAVPCRTRPDGVAIDSDGGRSPFRRQPDGTALSAAEVDEARPGVDIRAVQERRGGRPAAGMQRPVEDASEQSPRVSGERRGGIGAEHRSVVPGRIGRSIGVRFRTGGLVAHPSPFRLRRRAEPRRRAWTGTRRRAGNDRPPDDATVRITVYVVTGRQGWLWIPESFCRECHRFVRAADAAAGRADASVDVRVVSWYTHLPWALRHGGYHPPVMVVGGRRIAQAYDVPAPDRVQDAIREAAASGD